MAVPPFSLTRPRYNMDTFGGRLRRVDCSSLFDFLPFASAVISFRCCALRHHPCSFFLEMVDPTWLMCAPP
jgi:hypothetical protein